MRPPLIRTDMGSPLFGTLRVVYDFPGATSNRAREPKQPRLGRFDAARCRRIARVERPGERSRAFPVTARRAMQFHLSGARARRTPRSAFRAFAPAGSANSETARC